MPYQAIFLWALVVGFLVFTRRLIRADRAKTRTAEETRRDDSAHAALAFVWICLLVWAVLETYWFLGTLNG